jgi:hypothetical protein
MSGWTSLIALFEVWLVIVEQTTVELTAHAFILHASVNKR